MAKLISIKTIAVPFFGRAKKVPTVRVKSRTSRTQANAFAAIGIPCTPLILRCRPGQRTQFITISSPIVSATAMRAMIPNRVLIPIRTKALSFTKIGSINPTNPIRAMARMRFITTIFSVAISRALSRNLPILLTLAPTRSTLRRCSRRPVITNTTRRIIKILIPCLAAMPTSRA